MTIEAEKPNIVIRDWVGNGGAEGWQYKDLARDLYETEAAFRFYFFSPRNLSDYVMPQAVLGFEKDHVNTLAYYSLIPDAKGLSFGITFNTVHLNRPRWSLYETLAHEMMHLYVENNPTLEKHAKGHGKLFTAWCEEIGLHPRIGSGCHFRMADGQFERLMARWGVEKPKEADRVVPKDTPKDNWWDIGPRPKGGSSLLLYVCDTCSRSPQCKVRTGRADLELACLKCEGQFHPI